MNRMNRTLRPTLTALAFAAASVTGGAALGWAAEPEDERASYSFVRSIDGEATLASSVRAPGEPIGINEPLQRGDQVRVERSARVEIVLADRNLLRVGGGAALRLTEVAFSADGDDRTTRLDLEEGEILLDVTDEALGDELPEIRTPAGTVFIHQPGRYRILLSATGDLQVTVRDGYAELLTERGSTVIRSGEEAWTGDDAWGAVQVTAAGPLGALERWGDELEQRSLRASSRELRVEPQLAYAASNLDDYGSWVYVDASWYWRPRVAVGWRPYWDGRWTYTPSGLTWVSNEPWGWVPYHYGSWSLVPGYGWIWRPGYHYAPAWVYWHVGPSWTGWCPVGYYTWHYRNYWDYGFRFGIYGWAGGGWGAYADWCFLPSRRLFDRDGHGFRRTGTHLGRTEPGEVPRGIVTTDTRGLPRERWERPDELVRDLERRRGGREVDTGGPLPEVTDFVARRPTLPPAVERAVLRDPVERRHERRGSPLDPGAPSVDSRGRGGDVADWRGRERGGRIDIETSGRRMPGERLGGGFGRESAERGRPSLDGRAVREPQQPSARGGVSGRDERLLPSPRADERSARPIERAPVAGGPVGDDRQGWRRHTASPGDDRSSGRSSGLVPGGADRGERSDRGAGERAWSGAPGASSRADEPVSRVIDGVRRTQPGERGGSTATPPARTTPPAGWRGSPDSVAPRAAAPPVDRRPPAAAPSLDRRPQSAPPPSFRSSPGGATPRTTTPPVDRRRQAAPPSARAPQASPTPRGSAPTAKAPPPSSNRGSGRPAVSSGSGSSSSDRGQGSQTSSGSSRSQSSQSSSPPPRRSKPPSGGG